MAIKISEILNIRESRFYCYEEFDDYSLAIFLRVTTSPFTINSTTYKPGFKTSVFNVKLFNPEQISLSFRVINLPLMS